MTTEMIDRNYHRVLTLATVRIHMDVMVYSHPHLEPCPHYGKTGRIVGLTEPPYYRAMALVAIREYGWDRHWIPLYQLVDTTNGAP